MIREMQNTDIERVMEIWLTTSKVAHDFIDEKYWDENYDKVKNEYLPMGKTYIYEEDNILKGFVSIINEEFIGAIFIDNNYRGNGIGTKLMDYLKNKHSILSLSVYKDNISSLNFYRKQGFKVIADDFNNETKCIEYLMKYEGEK